MKKKLIAGCINKYPPKDGWELVHMDASSRQLYVLPDGGYTDPDIVADLADIPVGDGEFDEVRCHQTLEHLTRDHARRALQELRRVLKPKGVLDIEVPDLAGVIEQWNEGMLAADGLCQMIYGQQGLNYQDNDLMAHRYGYIKDSLNEELWNAEFEPGPCLDTGTVLRFRAVAR